MPYAVEQCLEKKEMTIHATNKMIEYIGDKMYGICRYPTKEDYKTVARKMVNEYPLLKDKIGSGYMSTSCTVFLSVNDICVTNSSNVFVRRNYHGVKIVEKQIVNSPH